MDADHYVLYVSKILLIPCIMKLGDKDMLPSRLLQFFMPSIDQTDR